MITEGSGANLEVVEYVHSDGEVAAEVSAAAATAPAGAELSLQAISQLPLELVTQLRGATASADADRLEELIRQVAAIDEAIAEGLQKLVDDFEYERLSELLGNS
jgi:hypothetical protein